MPDIKFKQCALDEIFCSHRGNSQYTKSYCHTHPGEYEVFTGTTLGTFGKIDTYDYDYPNLTYTTDGINAGDVSILSGKYNIGGHRALLTPLQKKVFLPYFLQILEPILKKLVKNGNVPSVTWAKIRKELISVPIDDEGSFDIDAQKELSERLLILKKKAQELTDFQLQLKESYVYIPLQNIKYVEKSLNELFRYVRGRSCTKSYCNQHKGEYPVWSANNNEPLAFTDFFDYEGTYISLSRNGIAGKIKILSGKFTINEDRFILIPIQENIDYNYIRYIMEPILRTKTKGRAGHNGQNEFTKLSFSILDTIRFEIPVNTDGENDLVVQQAIAKKYSIVENLKEGICQQIGSIVDSKILI